MPAPASVWRLRTKDLDLTGGLLMGVLNVTPDSFSDGGRFTDETVAIARGLELVEQGADLVDVGGESTRPGSEPVSPDLEMQRVIPVIEALAGEGVMTSIDTSKAEVAEAALIRGAEVVNDVTAGSDPGMLDLVAAAGAGLIVMHMQGRPRDMQDDPQYDDVVSEVEEFLVQKTKLAFAAGIDESRVAIDPGIGFGKTLEHNIELLRHLDRLASHAPLVIGASRKTFLGTITGASDPEDRDLATAVTTALAFLGGARVFRVHDVPSSRQALQLVTTMVREH